MTTPLWQLSWVGPRITGNPATPLAVMPDPAMGCAHGLCVPVVRQADGTLSLAQPTQIYTPVEVPLGGWTQLTLSPTTQPCDTYLCLLRYERADHNHSTSDALRLWSTAPEESVPGEFKDLQDALAALREKDPHALDAHLVRLAPAIPLPSANVKDGHTVCLAFASCQYPAGLLDRRLAHASYERLADHLVHPEKPQPEVLLLLGDQIYADATAGLLDSRNADDRYQRPYEDLFNIPALQRIMRRMPVHMMLDDHEINDNWQPYRPGATGRYFQDGMAAYWAFQRMSASPGQKTWRQDISGDGWSLFFADSRSCRDYRAEQTLSRALILGSQQTQDLEAWLAGCHKEQPQNLKLVSTSAMLLPRPVEHRHEPLYLDSWAGYPASLHRLLAYLCDHQVQHVWFLSGDAHLGCDADITVTNCDTRATVKIGSIHTPALYAPLPFANERSANLLFKDNFCFDHKGSHYGCSVNAWLPTPQSDGSRLFLGTRQGSNWAVTCPVI